MRSLVIFSAFLALVSAQEINRNKYEVIDLTDSSFLTSTSGFTSSSGTSGSSAFSASSAAVRRPAVQQQRPAQAAPRRTVAVQTQTQVQVQPQQLRQVTQQRPAAPRPAAPRPAAPRPQAAPRRVPAPAPAPRRVPAPAPAPAPAPVVHTQHEVKTLIYVLSKKTPGNAYPEAPAPIINKPEVFFVKYDHRDDTNAVIKKIQDMIKEEEGNGFRKI